MQTYFNNPTVLGPPAYNTIKYHPIARLEKKPGIATQAYLLGLKRSTSWFPKLSDDGTFCLYDSTTFKPISRPKNPHKNARTICVTKVSAARVASGGDDGSIVIAGIKHGSRSAKFQPHGGSVVGLDVWCDYLVSTDEQKNLRIYHLKGIKAKPMKTIPLLYVPDAVHIVTYNTNSLLVLLERKDLCVMELYSMVDGLLVTLNMRGEHSSGNFVLEGVSLNLTRTHYVAATSYIDPQTRKPIGLITMGSFSEISTKKNFIVSGNFADAAIACNLRCSIVYVSEKVGKVHCLSIGDLRTLHYFDQHEGALSSIHVRRVGDYDRVVTEGTDGETLLWANPMAVGR